MTEVMAPNGWCVATIMDVATASGGGTPSKSDPSYWDEGTIPWVSPKDMKSFLVTSSEDSVTTKALGRLTLIPSKSILIVVRSGILSRTLPVSINKIPVTVNQDMRAFVPALGVDARYIAWQLVSKERDILDRCAKDGTTVASIEGPALARYPMAIAPLNEQTRIVEKLEELLSDLDAGVAELKAAQRKLARYRQSLLKAAVEGALTADWRAARVAASSSSSLRKQGPSDSRRNTAKSLDSRVRGNDGHEESGAGLLQRILTERRTRWETKQLAKYAEQGKTPPNGWQSKYPEPVAPDTTDLPALPAGWVWATLSQVGWLDRGRSKHRPRNAPHLYGGPYPFVQTGDIRDSDTFIHEASTCYSEAGLAQSRLWPTNTLCITIAANIGKTALLAMEACFPDSVVGYLPASDAVSVHYIEYFMRTAQQKLENEAPATAQKNINLEILERLPVPVPPASEQFALVEKLSEALLAVRAQLDAIDLGIKQAAAQRKNILKAAFAGQLVPQDPRDEPASALLERIRAERAMGGTMDAKRGRKAKEAL